MTTMLRKPVARQTIGKFRNYGPGARQVVVSLEPGDVLVFRLFGKRTRYTLGINVAMEHAVRLEAQRLRAERAEIKAAKRMRSRY